MDALDLKCLIQDMERTEPHPKYEEYLVQHIGNVQRAYNWIKDNIPSLLDVANYCEEVRYYGELDEIIAQHDQSKRNRVPNADEYYELKLEYDEYADYFYGVRDQEVEEKFDLAWLSHIHQNPHHWQHWMLQNDDPEIGLRLLDMPYVFIVEMVCDWWAFSWKSGNLYEIFDWYKTNKNGILLSDKTRVTLENILSGINAKLEELGVTVNGEWTDHRGN